MRIGGLLILVFLIYHILHFTVGTAHPSFAEGNPYANVVNAFRNPIVVIVYELALIAVGLHLFHGTWSAFRSLGLVKPALHPLRHKASVAVSGLIWLGFALIPVLILAGVGR
jgi:succinate dehydrogenase / fumarate reductase cytochrome b subunit